MNGADYRSLLPKPPEAETPALPSVYGSLSVLKTAPGTGEDAVTSCVTLNLSGPDLLDIIRGFELLQAGYAGNGEGRKARRNHLLHVLDSAVRRFP